ncbi:Fur family transcriptional regulator [Dyadobacter sp. NIV53]|uniref:Fur family transcriptional regulator n=1 Tax=Dyadobacter sp. NIV53 TaxID=2861765 RepID=UPI001C87A2FC|nr:transcriptional repressor [Dyadobacter sp. NIV53]
MLLSKEIVAYCESRKLRCTAKRLMVADFLQEANGQADADVLYMMFRSNSIRISPASIYQILDWMVKIGFVERMPGNDRKNIYCIKKYNV